MRQYKIKFSVDGKGSETIISANSQSDARKLLQAQYPNSKVIIRSIQTL